jgi:hypothetical protein
MPLNDTQIATLRADLPTHPELAAWIQSANDQAIADWYNTTATPDFNVFRTNVSIDEVFDAVTWANFTPADAPDATVQWSNRSLACQGKQFNLQTMLSGRTFFSAAKATLRGGLNDATTNLPSGVSGTNRSGGWTTILPILRRLANRVEKLFGVQTAGVGVVSTDPLGATTNPALMTYEGKITAADIGAAR